MMLRSLRNLRSHICYRIFAIREATRVSFYVAISRSRTSQYKVRENVTLAYWRITGGTRLMTCVSLIAGNSIRAFLFPLHGQS